MPFQVILRRIVHHWGPQVVPAWQPVGLRPLRHPGDFGWLVGRVPLRVFTIGCQVQDVGRRPIHRSGGELKGEKWKKLAIAQG